MLYVSPSRLHPHVLDLSIAHNRWRKRQERDGGGVHELPERRRPHNRPCRVNFWRSLWPLEMIRLPPNQDGGSASGDIDSECWGRDDHMQHCTTIQASRIAVGRGSATTPLNRTCCVTMFMFASLYCSDPC